jgi:hypothetical protein
LNVFDIKNVIFGVVGNLLGEFFTRPVYTSSHKDEGAYPDDNHEDHLKDANLGHRSFGATFYLIHDSKIHHNWEHELNGDHEDAGDHSQGGIELIQTTKQETASDANRYQERTPDQTRDKVLVQS